MAEIPQLFGPEFYGFVLPWIFTFAIVYGLLLKLSIFGGDNKRISAALAFVMAFFVTAVGGRQLAVFFINLFGGASVFLAGILVILLFGAMIGKDLSYWSDKGWALAFVVVLGVVLFISSSGTGFLGVSISGDLATLIFALIVVLVAAHFVMSEGGSKAAGAAKPEGH